MATVQAEPYEFAFEPGTTALLIIDMQRDFVDPGGFGEALGNDVSLLRKAIAPTRRVLDAARERGLLVVHTREGHRPDLADLPEAKKLRGRLKTGIGDPGPMGRILVRGEYGHDIIDELKPAAGEPVVDKPGKGAFHATDLGALLQNRGIRQLVVCGVTTEVCVNTTVLVFGRIFGFIHGETLGWAKEPLVALGYVLFGAVCLVLGGRKAAPA